MSHDLHHLHPRRLPYLVGAKTTPVDQSEDDKKKTEDWLNKREECRKSHEPSNWWSYYRQCYHVKIRNGDALGLWTSHSVAGTDSSDLPTSSEDLPFVLMLHGGGYSGLTWAPMIDELSRLVEAEYGSLDLRGHGESECGDEKDLSLDILTQDILDAIKWMEEGPIKLGKRRLILVGHSMGGALGVNVALKLQDNNSINLAGLIVLDVVEGSAMQALNSMQFFLRSRPQEFKSMSEAIQWCVRSGQTKNLDSARISIPGQLKVGSIGKASDQFINPNGVVEACDNNLKRSWTKLNPEDPENSIQVLSRNSPSPSNSDNYIWRIDLSKTEPYWRGWFEGLSVKFLSVKCPKLLMLAGVDRLDRELTVGQMQGKFQMQVFHQVGHAVHEDVPEKAAECIASFLNRQRLVKTKTQLTPSMPGC